MNANGLVDPGFSGTAFTWTNNKDAGSRIYSRLDRFLISSSILDEFQGLKVKHLSRLTSDHCPILCSVQAGAKRNYSSWIWFEDVWASFPKAWQLVSEKWKVQDSSSEAKILQRKCQRTLKALFFWSRNKIKMLNQLKDDLDREISTMQEIDCYPSGLSEAQSESLRYKVQLLKATLTRLTTWWGQRAKVRWIEEGDGNTRFFHNMASARRRTNLIDQLKHPDGRLVTISLRLLEWWRIFSRANGSIPRLLTTGGPLLICTSPICSGWVYLWTVRSPVRKFGLR
ncbi:uncharacterized protein LOC110103019 [Dendrobium catenatum]|uniref:uncharacterized protein LOC110103019 n=1 Tax=Dendrobium catenatum TaxID=906689 RepID=UPI0009F16F60|nr:uncharacterized protein LOC110103019 [Dendrobium catenatum]